MGFASCYRNMKVGLATLGWASAAGLLVIGIPISGGITGAIMCTAGVVSAITSCLIVYDTMTMTYMLKKEVYNLKTQNKNFKQENMTLTRTSNELKVSTYDLRESLTQSEAQIKKLSMLKSEYETTLNSCIESLKDEREINDELKDSVSKLYKVKQNLLTQVDKLSFNIKATNSIVKTLAAVEKKLMRENSELKQLRDDSKNELAKLTKQVSKLKDMYTNTCVLLKNMTNAGNIFSEYTSDIKCINNSLEETSDGYSDNLDRMNKLLKGMTSKTFSAMDTNSDNVITADEFRSYVSK